MHPRPTSVFILPSVTRSGIIKTRIYTSPIIVIEQEVNKPYTIYIYIYIL